MYLQFGKIIELKNTSLIYDSLELVVSERVRGLVGEPCPLNVDALGGAGERLLLLLLLRAGEGGGGGGQEGHQDQGEELKIF